MKKFKKEEKHFVITMIVLFVLCIGIGYAILTQKLKINNGIVYTGMSWDVGFTNAEDNGGSIPSTISITDEGQTLTINCDLGTNTSQESCIAKATITNNSTIPISLNNRPTIIYDSTYIHTVTFKWVNHEVYGNTTVLKGNFIDKQSSEDVIISIKTKKLTKSTMLSNDSMTCVSITLNFIELKNQTLPTINDLSILKSTSSDDTTAFRSDTYKEKIKTITFEDKINVPENVISWDISDLQNGTVMAYITTNATDSSYYDLYIQGNTNIYANEDMSYWFYNLSNLDSIKGIELLDTSNMKNMSDMFGSTGSESTIFTLNVSHFDTSQVTDMSATFRGTAYNSTLFDLDVSEFDTSNVTNMNNMFASTGYLSQVMNLDVSNFNTSKVTNMSSMFECTAYSNPTFTLDISNFDTSNVTDMSWMFSGVGHASTIFSIDVNNFDTSNVTNMSGMFDSVGYNNPSFRLNTSHFDTGKVTDFSYMFCYTGYKSTKFNTSITIKNANTKSYKKMFIQTAVKSGAQIVLNYTRETSDIVDEILSQKPSESHVYKGKLVY